MNRVIKSVHSWSRDQWLRGKYLVEWLRGRELWVRPDIRRQKLRLGHSGGEWCVCPDAITRGGLAYCFGVGEEISFDLDLIRQFNLKVHAFDPTPISAEWLARQQTPPQFHFHPEGLSNRDGTIEFTLPVSHGVSFTMLKGIDSKMSAQCQVRRLKTIMQELGHQRLEILKMDIEGAEYDVVDDLAEAAPKIGQLLIEFHHRMVTTGDGLQKTKETLQTLGRAGFRIFYVAPFGLEYSLIHCANSSLDC